MSRTLWATATSISSRVVRHLVSILSLQPYYSFHEFSRIKVQPRGRLGLVTWLHTSRWQARVSLNRDGRQPGQNYSGSSSSDAARRCCHVLPRNGPRLSRFAKPYAIRALPRDKRCPRFRRGAIANAGELVRLSRMYLGHRTLILALIRCWEPKVLKQMSKHYKTDEPLSDELIEKLVRRCADAGVLSAPFWTNSRHFSRYVNVGLFYLRQLFFAWFDYRVHTDKGKLVGRQHF